MEKTREIVGYVLGGQAVPTEPDGSTISTNGARVWAYCRGEDGGQVVACGTPEAIRACKDSITGRFI